MSEPNTIPLGDAFSAWGEYTPTHWQSAIGDIAEWNYRRSPYVAAALAKFEAEHQAEVDLDHLPLLGTAMKYAAILGYSLARTWPTDGIESLGDWVERAWAFGDLGEPVGEREP